MGTAKLFFELIRYAIKGDELSSQTLKGVSAQQLDLLFNLSKNHDCAHLITYALYQNGLIDKEHPSYKKFVYEQSLAVFRYENINYELNNVVHFLEQNQIENIPLKGSVIRSLYPEPWMRTSCDIDILVKKKDAIKTTKLLTEQYGCKLEHIWDYEISLFTPRNVHLEIHSTLEAEKLNDATNKVLEKVWDTASTKQGYSFSKEMADDTFYFYHVAHTAKHFFDGGCGVRPFIDLWLLDNLKDGNEERRLKHLNQVGFDKFIKVAKKLTRVWFESDLHDDLSRQVEEFVLHAGTYGTAENHTIYEQKKKGGKFRYALSRIFLSFKNLSAQYPVLKKQKWLYPFCQVARWFRLLFCGGVKRSVKEIKEIKNRPNHLIETRENMMKELGLWK